MEQINFLSTDGLEIFGHISSPKYHSPSHALLLISGGIHGGAKFDNGLYDPLHIEITDYLNSNGFLTFIVDKRGSKGYSTSYKRKIDFCGKEVDDIAEGGKFLKSLPELSDKSISIHGTSRGSTLAALIISRSNLFTSAILSSGFYDIRSQYEYELKNRPEMFPTNKVLNGRRIEDFPCDTLSPINLVDRVDCPVLIVHGFDDENVLLEQSTRYYERLRELGKRVRMITYPNLAHFKKYSFPSNPIGELYWKDCISFLKNEKEYT